MDDRVQELARRFKHVLDEVARGREAAEVELERQQAEARAARHKLLSELADFGEAVGHIEVTRAEDRVALRRDERELVFSAEGVADRVVVQLLPHSQTEGAPPIHIYRHPDAAMRWVLSVGEGRAAAAELLFDSGLIHLLTEGLGLPAPMPALRAPQPALDDLVPDKG
ncbi:MAG: hypothetical protein EA397_07360 [Deltaproteobacteria bacterium]|nr:MAG: hypothetical protein EA397_07360 [Deltaproteobacteria bacterium]